MSTSLLYHAFGLRDQKYLKTVYTNGQIELYTETNKEKLCCSSCGSYNVIKRGSKIRRFKSLPIGKRRVFIMSKIQGLECFKCATIRQEKIKFAEFKKAYTRSLKRYILDLSGLMTISDIALLLGMTWDTIKDIQKENLQIRYGNPDLKELKNIAIDEIAVKKGHKYITLVLDMSTGAIVYVGNGKGADSLLAFWKVLKRSGARIDSVAIDMSRAYIDAVGTNLKDAAIVFDHFHIIKLYNDKLSELRKEIFNYETAVEKKTFERGKMAVVEK